MDQLRRGTWLLHTSKHLNSVRQDAPEQDYFEASSQAGKAGNLLARMAADTTEILTRDKLKAYARAAHVKQSEIEHSLRLLRKQGRVDYSLNEDGLCDSVEVYSFSGNDALSATSAIYDQIGPSPQEQGALASLEQTFFIPQTQNELMEAMTNVGIREADADLSLRLQSALGLLKRADAGRSELYYNEYAFVSDDPTKALKALEALPSDKAQQVRDIQALLAASPGYPMDLLRQKFPEKTIEMMEGIGMIDAMPVRSPNGQAVYVTIPQLRGVAIDQPFLSVDVFHKAKTLLNSLRYGQHNSYASRGKIVDDSMLFNIVRKLVRGEEVGPSTAAGEDYRMLETDGVISTRQYRGAMRFMTLRQKDVGVVVLQMLQYNMAVPESDVALLTDLGAVAMDRDIPEVRRAEILNRRTQTVEIAHNEMLQVIRTGARNR